MAPQSERSASAGSTRAARRAGTHVAPAATAISTSLERAREAGGFKLSDCGKARSAKRRQVPKCAEFRSALSSELRQIPNYARGKLRTCGLLARLEPPRHSGPAPFGTRALRGLALFQSSICTGLQSLRMVGTSGTCRAR